MLEDLRLPAATVRVDARLDAPEAFLPLSRPSITAADAAAVTAVLESGWITTGSVCAELERRFAARVGSRHAVALTSATAGMHLLLHALGIGSGDEVVTPSMTWVSTVNLITLAGATPVFVDVDADTLMTTATHVEPALTARTRLIVPVHFAGAALDLEPLRALAARRGVPLVEDAAHAAGTEYAGRPIGAEGTAIFSFHPIKNLTTGEGGMLCTDSDELAARIRRLRFHGLGADAFDREAQGRSPQAEVQEPGFKYNLPDMNAALGLGQLDRLDEMNARRAALAAHYRERLEGIAGVQPLAVPSYPMRHAWHLFVVRIDAERAGLSRDELMARLKARGIGTGLHFRAVHLHRYYVQKRELRRKLTDTRPLRDTAQLPPDTRPLRDTAQPPPDAERPPRDIERRLSDTEQPLPNTEWNSARICSLPLFPDMTAADVDRVVDAIRAVVREARREAER